ncbi:cell division protein FtsX [Stakelama pacifica]|uniref:Cell division transport system permease protein n=1 Tax=Stakelama pacifica TaxID=517720 RepID=A0A4V3BTC8_9SPHN|nr:FtsX-like permease family protein [Stakelama pacifica]TDN82938.1 cell division transport system permease protein [Stakelama pacifica]
MAFPARSARHGLLDSGRHSRVMVWIMAIMVFLTVLAAGSGLAIRNGVTALDSALSARLTVQVAEADAALRDRETAAIIARLKAMPMVRNVEQVPPQRLRALLQPWLGSDGLDKDIALPSMIDVDLVSADAATIAHIRAAARQISDAILVDPHAAWLSPVRDLFAALGWSALSIVVLTTGATMAIVLLGARTGLDTHRDTIDVLHMLGSTDRQVARLFERRIAFETLIGGAIGAVAALCLIRALQLRFAAPDAQLLDAMTLGAADWAMLAAIPLACALIALAAARIAVRHRLERLL